MSTGHSACMNRRDFLKGLGVGAAAISLGPVGSSVGAAVDGPNIVFIIVDDMGYQDLGCYGGRTIKTPNIDRMAGEGMRFTDAYSGATVCAPARSTLMTGYHLGHTSVRGNSGGIPLLDSDITVAEILRKRGYATGGFGKWGLGDVGTAGVAEKQGFDVFFGYYHQVHAHSYYTPYLWRNSKRVPLSGNEDKKQQQYTHNEIARETLNFIRENKDRPFFCYAPWTPPHGKYEFPKDDPAWKMYADKPWPNDAKVVAAMDTMIDRHVGEILKLLRELKIDDKTIVFFCSDNGAARRFDGIHNSSGPMKGFKRSLYEGGIRVPMIARWPGRIKAGTVSDLPWYFPDVMPTLAELTDATKLVPPDIDGISVVATLSGKGRQSKHEYLYWEFGRTRAVRMGRFKAIRKDENAKLELDDLAEDMGEKNDLASRQPDIAAKMGRIMKEDHVDPRPQIEPKQPRGKRFL